MAGFSPTSSELIHAGQPNATLLTTPLPSSTPLGTVYLWLNSSSPLSSIAITITPNLTLPYIPYLTASPSPSPSLSPPSPTPLTFTATTLTNLTSPPASFSSPTGLCAVPTSTPFAPAVLHLTLGAADGPAAYDSIDLGFGHDCFYPSVAIGSSPSFPSDILSPPSPSSPPPGTSPTLTPTNATLLTTTQAHTELRLYLSIAPSPSTGYPADSAVPFTTAISSSFPSISPTVQPSPSEGGQLLVGGAAVEGGNGELLVISTCEEGWGGSGTVQLLVWFGFALPLNVSMDVQCGGSLGKAPWEGLTITTPTVPTADPSGTTTMMYGAGHVQALFSRPPSSPTLASLVPSFTLSFEYPANTSYRMELSADVIPQSTGVVSHAVTSYGYVLQGVNDTIPLLPLTGSFSLAISTLCAPVASNLTTRIRIAGTQLDSPTIAYDEILLYYSWPCPWPVPFDISTSNGAATTPNLMTSGVPVQQSRFPYSQEEGTAGVFTINLDDAKYGAHDAFALYVRTPSPPMTFTWELDLSASLNAQSVVYDMRYNAHAASPPSYTFTLQNAAWSGALEMVSMRCTAAGDHVLTTYLWFDYSAPVQLNFQRQCVAPDATGGGGTGLSAGAVVGVLLLVAVVAGCVVGCVYNRVAKGKKGWEMLPSHAWWVSFQDTVLGPKRYSAQLEEDDGEEVEIPTSYGTYGSGANSYQNDL